MLKKYLLSVSVLCAACTQDSQLTVTEIEKAGFEKDQQQLFQMVGADDGWSGIWNNEVVEIYTFEERNLEKNEFFKSINVDSNPSAWTDKCAHKNVILLSKGKESCPKLREL